LKVIISILVIIAVLSNSESGSYAQSGTGVKLHGDSLIRINRRNVQHDFGKFFDPNYPGNKSDQQNTSEELPFSESASFSETPVTLQPAQQNINGNDGLQVQVDLGNGR
jgi:hypothetical protein